MLRQMLLPRHAFALWPGLAGVKQTSGAELGNNALYVQNGGRDRSWGLHMSIPPCGTAAKHFLSCGITNRSVFQSFP